VLVSRILADFTVKLAPALFALTVSAPRFVIELVVSVKKIMLFAVTTEFETVTVPLDRVPVPVVNTG
jgi:hypothetical protein